MGSPYNPLWTAKANVNVERSTCLFHVKRCGFATKSVTSTTCTFLFEGERASYHVRVMSLIETFLNLVICVIVSARGEYTSTC